MIIYIFNNLQCIISCYLFRNHLDVCALNQMHKVGSWTCYSSMFFQDSERRFWLAACLWLARSLGLVVDSTSPSVLVSQAISMRNMCLVSKKLLIAVKLRSYHRLRLFMPPKKWWSMINIEVLPTILSLLFRRWPNSVCFFSSHPLSAPQCGALWMIAKLVCNTHVTIIPARWCPPPIINGL